MNKAEIIAGLEAKITQLTDENSSLLKELAVKSVISEISQFQNKEEHIDSIYKKLFFLIKDIISIDNFFVVLDDDKGINIPFIIDQFDNIPKEKLNEKNNPLLRKSLTAYALSKGQSLVLSEIEINKLIKNEKIELIGKTPKQWVFLPFHNENINGGLVAQSYQTDNSYSHREISILAYVTMHVGNFISSYTAKQKIKQQFEALKSTQSQLVQSEKMASIGQLAAGVAHEINNPLGYVNSNLNSLKSYIQDIEEFITNLSDNLNKIGDLNVEQSEIKTVIENTKEQFDIEFILTDTRAVITDCIFGMDKVKKIVISLKNFSHVGEEQTKLTDVNECIEETVRIVWNELKYHCKIETELLSLPETYCHPSQLNQVFMNLLINAGHAIEKDGLIQIKTYLEDNQIIIKFQDNGSGIDEKNLSQIFNPFFTTKPVGQGTGLGLSISYGIIENHGGKIEIETELGVGTCFIISLPVIAQLDE